ncbi:MAG: efflux RND transporter permease subunit [Schleiferiaceae bacterium]|nr:efflux RND transporter permease subunit [Schleiferiaceae bacterium]MDR9442460.1 efflux RND transporter permease subunit [Schleiferiaceae bacterium]
MKMDFFIDRPVFSTVISILILLLGILGVTNLPVTQYPDIAPPTVEVTASYPGANAQTMIENVVIPLEEAINGVEGMTYITSNASNNGAATIQVFFKKGVNPDIAAVNVQNRVSRATSLLPAAVVRAGVTTEKKQNSALMYCALYSTNADYDDTYVQNYLNINVKPALQRIDGVGQVNVFGGKDYAMRIWLQPEALAQYGLEPADVTAALNEQSREAAAGAIGENSGQPFQYVIRYQGRLKTAEAYRNIILRAQENGELLRLEDVAQVELDATSYSTVGRTRGHPSVSFGIFQTPGSNAQEIAEELYETLDQLEKDFPPGVKYIINYDINRFLTASISKVQETLIEAFLLVFLVVILFLQDFRSTTIPGLAVPVSIIGTFFFLQILGYSINLLTLFALVLAIGIVVDDAIVVVEAVYAKLETGRFDSARAATKEAMQEITGAIISITLVMAAVFVPITFVKGPVGVFYEQFGVTLIIAILLSAVNALTLSPALSALFLKPPQPQTATRRNIFKRFFRVFNAGFENLRERYVSGLRFLVRHRWVSGLVLLLAVGGIIALQKSLPGGFVPREDRGVIFVNYKLPNAASLGRTYQAMQKIYQRVETTPGVRSATFVSGRNFFSGNGSSYGLGFVLLDRFDQREADSLAASALVKKLFAKTGDIADAEIIFFTPPSVPGYSASDGFEVRLLDRSAGSLKELDQVASQFAQQLSAAPSIAYANNSFSTNFPQYELEVNVARAKRAGVPVDRVLSALQGYVGGVYSADFSRFGKQFRVYVQSLPEDRQRLEDLHQMSVRTGGGAMAPLTEFVQLERVYGPQTIGRFNLFNNVTLNGGTAPGYATGQTIETVQQLAAEKLPQGYDIAFSGITREQLQSEGQTLLIFLLSLVFVYFFLAAQYESYLLPLAVVFSLPLGVFGAYFTTLAAGLQNNIFFQIALIMLLGLLAKNAILIVEFARQRRRDGASLRDAAIEGARVRLRPILMTSFAFIIGLLPLVLANGVGAAGNRSIGTGAAGGLLIGTLLGLLITPVLYIVFQYLHEKVAGRPAATAQNEPS